MASDDNRPLQEELVVVVVGRLETRILEAEALEFGCPEREVGGVRLRVAVDVVIEYAYSFGYGPFVDAGAPESDVSGLNPQAREPAIAPTIPIAKTTASV